MAIEKNQQKPNRVREALGKIFEDQESPLFREYLRRYRDDPSSRVFAPLADAYRQIGRLDEAIRICRKGLEHHPDFQSGRVALARCLIDQRRLEEASTELEKVVRAIPENLLAERLLGETYFSLGRYKEALHRFRLATTLAPHDVSLMEKLHQVEQAIEQALPRPKIELEDHHQPVAPVANPEPDYFPELLAIEKEQQQELEKDFDEEANRNPVLDLLFQKEATLEDSFEVRHVSQAFEEKKEQPKPKIATETLGDLYFQQNLFDKALKIFEKLNSLSPNDALRQKIEACRIHLGVASEHIIRERKIKFLENLLHTIQQKRIANS